MILSRAAILAASDLRKETVEVPEWGGSVIVRELTEWERRRFVAVNTANVNVETREVTDMDAILSARVQVVAWATVDEAGQRLFTDDDARELNGKNGRVIERLAVKILQLSELGARSREHAEKNSVMRNGGSPSA
jgi:hypothetical protein